MSTKTKGSINAHYQRVVIFDILLANNGILTTNQVTEFLGVSKPTALRTMTELKALGLVNMKDDSISSVMTISLKEQFDWFLSEEFKTLREGFEPEETEPDPSPLDSASGSATIHDNNIDSDARKEKSPHTYLILIAAIQMCIVQGGKILYAAIPKFLTTIHQPKFWKNGGRRSARR
jgi:hypothetical protein